MEFEVENLQPKEEKFPEGTSKVIFKTLSPLIVRKKTEDGKRVVIEPDDPSFEEEFNRVQEKIFKTLGYPYRWIKIKPIEPKGEAIRTIWSNTDGKIVKIPAYSGLFELEGPSEVLKLLYQKGLGEKTAEGFGMVEVHQPNTI
jgi:CRISPR-associated endoribonuclease Cas6